MSPASELVEVDGKVTVSLDFSVWAGEGAVLGQDREGPAELGAVSAVCGPPGSACGISHVGVRGSSQAKALPSAD